MSERKCLRILFGISASGSGAVVSSIVLHYHHYEPVCMVVLAFSFCLCITDRAVNIEKTLISGTFEAADTSKPLETIVPQCALYLNQPVRV